MDAQATKPTKAKAKRVNLKERWNSILQLYFILTIASVATLYGLSRAGMLNTSQAITQAPATENGTPYNFTKKLIEDTDYVCFMKNGDPLEQLTN